MFSETFQKWALGEVSKVTQAPWAMGVLLGAGAFVGWFAARWFDAQEMRFLEVQRDTALAGAKIVVPQAPNDWLLPSVLIASFFALVALIGLTALVRQRQAASQQIETLTTERDDLTRKLAATQNPLRLDPASVQPVTTEAAALKRSYSVIAEGGRGKASITIRHSGPRTTYSIEGRIVRLLDGALNPAPQTFNGELQPGAGRKGDFKVDLDDGEFAIVVIADIGDNRNDWGGSTWLQVRRGKHGSSTLVPDTGTEVEYVIKAQPSIGSSAKPLRYRVVRNGDFLAVEETSPVDEETTKPAIATGVNDDIGEISFVKDQRLVNEVVITWRKTDSKLLVSATNKSGEIIEGFQLWVEEPLRFADSKWVRQRDFQDYVPIRLQGTNRLFHDQREDFRFVLYTTDRLYYSGPSETNPDVQGNFRTPGLWRVTFRAAVGGMFRNHELYFNWDNLKKTIPIPCDSEGKALG